ncbi:MAG: DUF4212 domain-containing protein [Armatimonadetes bacterium]|nr:DUF4212 domain-containing protein [Armatimonadota bacterium]
MAEPTRPADYWRANETLIRGLLVLWAGISLGAGILLAEPLNRFHLGSAPLGFWIAQQGSIFCFVAIIFYYAWRMDRLDRDFGIGE